MNGPDDDEILVPKPDVPAAQNNLCCKIILSLLLKTLIVKFFLNNKNYFSESKEYLYIKYKIFRNLNLSKLSFLNVFRLAQAYIQSREEALYGFL